MSLRKQTRNKILIAGGVVLAIALLLLLALTGSNAEILKHLVAEDLSREELRELLEDIGWRGYAVTGALATLQVICAFLPAAHVWLAAPRRLNCVMWTVTAICVPWTI